MLSINYTCSFGSLCHSSKILKRNNLKLCSYPFDWIFSNCDNIIDCIEDNFNIFLDCWLSFSQTKWHQAFFV